MIALVDGDILVYRFGFSGVRKDLSYTKHRLTDLFLSLRDRLNLDDMEGYIGDGRKTFRHDIAVTAPYKGNREGFIRPPLYDEIRHYLKDEWGFKEVKDIETDDMLGIRATELGDQSIIVTIDKDLDQIPGWHFNFVKWRQYYVKPEEGRKHFWQQVLTGDTADNVVGLRGVGPVKAAKILSSASTDRECYECVLAAYEGDRERVLENARLLFILQEHGQDFRVSEPVGDGDKESKVSSNE